MEHRLILGGEQYLPFARSRIKALRATGLAYASQKFAMGDATVRVRIEPGHEYIEIEGGGAILMDNGVVDVGGVGELAPLTYKAGVLHKPEGIKSYDSSYTTPSGKNKLGDALYAKNPSGQPGNVTGHLNTFGGVSGRAPADAKTAESFVPIEVENDDGTTTPIDKDEMLRDKKIITVYCPASMFTGRARLYVQAMYGAPMYKTKTGGTNKDNPNYKLIYEPGNGAPPYLEIEPYVAEDDVNENGDKNYYVWPAITKNTGVYLDPVSFRHHLITINASIVDIYPMRVGSAAKSLIRLLDPKNSPKMTDEDRLHLEAYILSVSRPDAKARRTLTCESSTVPSCGYGWHWNWKGDMADAVENSYFPQYQQDPHETNPLYYGMESTHVRLTLNRIPYIPEGGEDGKEDKAHPNFSIAQTTVEGKTKWAIHSHKWCIAFPAWDGTLAKLTPQRTRMMECNAPFYAFYRGDELQVCRVIVTTKHEEPTREMSDNFTAEEVPVYGAATSAFTLAMGGGNLRDEYPQSDFWEVSFTCGDYTSPKTTHGKWNAIVTSEVSGKTIGAWDESGQEQDPVFTGNVPVGSPSGGNVALGAAGLNVGYPTQFFDAMFSAPDSAPLSFSLSKSSGTDSYNGLAEVVIPTYDSEAVIFDGIENKTNIKTTWTKTLSIDAYSTSYVTSFRTNPINRETSTLTGNISRNFRYGWGNSEGMWGNAGVELVTTDVVTESVVTERNAVLICHRGEVPITMEQGSLWAFHEHLEPEDVIPSPYFFRTGVHGNRSDSLAKKGPVVSRQTNIPDNVSEILFPVIVGWA